MSNPNWHNASKREKCPICHHDSWCNIANDGSAVICMRVESDHPTKGGGWLHRLRPVGDARPYQRGGGSFRTARTTRPDWAVLKQPPPEEAAPDPRFARLHASYTQSPEQIRWCAEKLGVTEQSLRDLDVRFCHVRRIISFPMRNADGVITGLRYRALSGKKFSEKGSKDGLFMPLELCGGPSRTLGLTASLAGSAGMAPTKPENGNEVGPDVPGRPPVHLEELYVVEGASDTAAGLSLGLPIIGRSACLTGTEHIRNLIRRFHLKRLTIIGDRDRPGMRGAVKLRSDIGIPARIVYPPFDFKDLRDWYRSGLLKNTDAFEKAAGRKPYRIG